MKFKLPLIFLFGMMAVLFLATGAQATPAFNTNLIVNGGAENGTAGWSVSAGTLGIGNHSSGWATPPANGGSHLFWGGQSSYSEAYQEIDLAYYHSYIDSSLLSFSLSGLFAGYYSQNDNAELTAIFKDDTDTAVGEFTIGGFTASDRADDLRAFYEDVQIESVPFNSKTVQILLKMYRSDFTDNDAYSDNLSFTLMAEQTPAPVPEPGTFILFGIGILALAGTSRQK
jgi:hypothetical protein